MMMNLPLDVLMTVFAYLPLHVAENLWIALLVQHDDSLRSLLLHVMSRSHFAMSIQKIARGMLTRNVNPAATFVALVYRAARMILRRVQHSQTDAGTPVCDGPVWIVNFGVTDNVMLFVPAAPSAREEEWPEYDLAAALSVTRLEICNTSQAYDSSVGHSAEEILKIAVEHPEFCKELRQLVSVTEPTMPRGDLHTPSDGVVFW